MPPYSKFMKVPGGLFTMGSKKGSLHASENETPQQNKHVPSFYLAKYPVTNQEYAAFVKATHYPAPTHWHNGSPPEDKLDHPVVEVDFDDALAYCNWLSIKVGHQFRLPREEEWEKAARGTADSRKYTWGDEWGSYRCNSKEDDYQDTTAVDRYEVEQMNPYGIVDMLGNVWEWVDSWFSPYEGNEYANIHYGMEKRVVRGGSYINDQTVCRVSRRGRYKVDTKRPYLGFRVASDHQPSKSESELPDSTEETKLTSRTRRNRQIRKILERYFELLDLHTLVTDLGFAPDNFTQKRNDMARELVAKCDKYGLVQKLINLIKQERPNVNWEEETP